jgi:hypothetical protein
VIFNKVLPSAFIVLPTARFDTAPGADEPRTVAVSVSAIAAVEDYKMRSGEMLATVYLVSGAHFIVDKTVADVLVMMGAK